MVKQAKGSAASVIAGFGVELGWGEAVFGFDTEAGAAAAGRP
jgi:hypothetical protein